MNMPTAEDIVRFYRIYLGRQPESEGAVQSSMKLPRTEIMSRILNSPEHRIKAAKSAVDIVIVGNCQASLYAAVINACTGLTCRAIGISPANLQAVASGENFVAPWFSNARLVCFTHGNDAVKADLTQLFQIAPDKLRDLPSIISSAFHPDMFYLKATDGRAIGTYHSRVASFAWRLGLSEAEAQSHFNRETWQALDYFDRSAADREHFARQSRITGLPLSQLFDRWMARKSSFMHTVNHPRIEVVADVAFALLQREGIAFNRAAASYLFDTLSADMSWQPYPEIAEALGFESDYYFKLPNPADGTPPGLHDFHARQIEGLDLPGFIGWQYAQLAGFSAAEVALPPPEQARFDRFRALVEAKAKAPLRPEPTAGSANPYKGLPDYQFWRRSVSALPVDAVDPVTRPRFTIARTDKVATAGSCFAQHISRTLAGKGFNYYLTESDDGPDAEARNFGVYSARYGNVYSTRQLLQLVERAFGRFSAQEEAWTRPDGRLVDPFRPQIEPEGFATLAALITAREAHLAAVRRMFETTDIFVFTLGLTEIWQNRQDGAVYPLAPGVVAGAMDPARHAFVNLDHEQVRADLQVALDLIKAVNPGIRVILTVSPVPLMATYENRHVLSSTTLSKSVLRAVADRIRRDNANVDYFPSFEIITGNHAAGTAFAEDLRTVRPEGVARVMRLFMHHYGDEAAPAAPAALLQAQARSRAAQAEDAVLAAVVCDEEALDA